MWMIAMLLLIGCIFLLPVLSFMFPVLFLAVPLLFMFQRPSVKVYTRTFSADDLNKAGSSQSRASQHQENKSLPNIIDVDYTEHNA